MKLTKLPRLTRSHIRCGVPYPWAKHNFRGERSETAIAYAATLPIRHTGSCDRLTTDKNPRNGSSIQVPSARLIGIVALPILPNFLINPCKNTEYSRLQDWRFPYPIRACTSYKDARHYAGLKKKNWENIMYTLMQRGLDRNRRTLLYSIPGNLLPGQQ